MFNLKRKITNVVQQFEPKENPSVVIEKIHNEFDSATEKLLSEARRILAENKNTKKGERLKKLGFEYASPSVEYEQIQRERDYHMLIAKRIEYFGLHYPSYKFITEGIVKDICKKYGLVFGDVYFYKADVPEKNIVEIEAFILREEDKYEYECKLHIDKYSGVWYGYEIPHPGYGFRWGGVQIPVDDKSITSVRVQPTFKICAAFSDFDTREMKIEDGYKLNLNIPDPVILQPVMDGYLIITKWGLEANDESLTNEKMN